MDADAYLTRIGATRPATVDAAALRELQERHLGAVPFENLDVILGVPIELDTDRLVTKVVGGRGGYCYELNTAFAALLRALGAEVTMLAAAVHGPAGLGPPFDHLALRVDLAEPWLVDVGFGRLSLHPLRLDSRADQADPDGTFRLAEHGDDLDVVRDGVPQYRLETRPRSLADFAPANWWQQTWPGSHFRRGPVASRQTRAGQVTISGRTLIRTGAEGRTETALGSDAEVLAAYREHLGIELDRVP
ncbi:MAG TPA: arylamine N-acetyltransferase [Mycobacteriales bacterium]